jgi:hypothetical protein
MPLNPLFCKHFRVESEPIAALPTNSINQHMEFTPPGMPALWQRCNIAPGMRRISISWQQIRLNPAAGVSRWPGFDPVCQADRPEGSTGPGGGGQIIHSA